ncbi:hypothetical protein ES702_07697 [subsurface metagenome]
MAPGTSFKDVINSLKETALYVLKEIAVKELSKTEAIQKEIETQKTVAGKNILWQYFPFIIAGLAAVAIIRFK